MPESEKKAFMSEAIVDELIDSGELVVSAALADPPPAPVRVRDGVPAVTDGPYVEAKEYLVGYYIVDCESLDRAAEIAAASRTRGWAVEIRRGHGAPAGDVRPGTGAPAHRGHAARAAPQVLGALVRRYGHFDACEDAVQEALLAAALQWPAQGMPAQPAGLADHRRVPAADRPVAQRRGPPAARGRRVGRAARRAIVAPDADASGRRPRRHARRCCSCAATPRCPRRRRSR